MTTVRVTGGYLNVTGFDPDGPVDQGFGGGIGAGHPDKGLPRRTSPASTTTLPSRRRWVCGRPPSFTRPIVPIGPDNTLPVQPWRTIWPIAMPPPPRPDQGLPGSQPKPDQAYPAASRARIRGCRPVPDILAPDRSGRVTGCCATHPRVGWKYVAVDPSLRPGMPVPQPVPTPKG